MYPSRKRKKGSDPSSRKRRRSEPDLRVTFTADGTRFVQRVEPTPVPDISVTVTPEGRRSVRLGRPVPDISVTVSPKGRRSVRLGTPLLVRNKRDIRNRTAPVTSEKPVESPAPDVQPMSVEEARPVNTTPRPETTITAQHEPPVAVATWSFKANYPHLNSESDRLQVIEGNYLWHKSHPDCYIVAESRTGEFIKHDGTPTGKYFSKANLFTRTPPAYGDRFWLTFDGKSYKVDNYATHKPVGTAQEVPWKHILQHTYDHFSDFNIKEAHTFWPAGTTEADVLKHLVDALNNNGTVDAFTINQVPYPARIRRDSNGAIKTFFLDQPVAADDMFTPDQLSDLADLIG